VLCSPREAGRGISAVSVRVRDPEQVFR